MGVLNIATVEGLQNFTTFTDLKALEIPTIQALIDRAESYISKMKLCSSNGPNYTEDIKVAIYKIAEIFFLKSSESLKRLETSGIKSERIGTYSYTLDTSKATAQLFDPLAMDFELKSIIDFYSCNSDDEVSVISTLVFRQLPEDSRGYREYVDVNDFVFQIIDDMQIKSFSSDSRRL